MSDFDIGQLPGQSFFCRVIIGGHEISPANIISLTIREWVLDILPRIEIVFGDLGTFLETYPFEDGAEINVTLAKQKDSKDALSMDFYLSDYSVAVKLDNKQYELTVVGIMKADNMFTIKTKSFGKKTSEDVFKVIAKEAGITFSNPNSVIPSDKMTWYQLNQCNYDFIKHILKRSFVPNDCIFFYASSNKKFTYTTLNKEIDKKTVRIAKYNIEQTEARDNPDKDKTLYYNAYDIVNMSGRYNKESNYGLQVKYYDLQSPKTIVYNSSKSLTKLTFKNKNYAGRPVYSMQGGLYNNLNVYSEKYFESLIRNIYLVNNFFAYSVVIQADPDEKVELFDKIDLVLPSILTEEMNGVISGEYLIGGIIHNVQYGSVYKKLISLHRNGMNESPYNKQPIVSKS